MILLQGNGIARTFGGDVLFENINFSLQDHSRIALVGRNGAGKSTLLKIIAGVEEASRGTVSQTKDLTMNYLAQDTGLNSSRTIFAEMLSVFDSLRQMEKQLRQMELQMGELAGDELTALMKRYDALSEEFRMKNGFTYESEIKSVLNGFRFDETRGKEISSLSGGQKTRLALAKMLLERPQLLILDEPTNHLDIETLAWLENYLKNYEGSLLIVSHDRYFLDKVVNEVLELSRGELTRFSGNYSRYVEQREQKLLLELKNFEKQQKEIAKLEDYVARNLVRASTTKMAQSRRKKLEKMERLEAPTSDDKSANVTFTPGKTSGNVVLTVSEATVGYEDNRLSGPINIDERKGESLAIVGPNGVGKTTLIKSIVGQIPFLAGQAKLGANVTLGYYDQEQGRLTASNTVLDELWNEHRLLNEVEIRNMLGAFLFSGDDVKKTVGMLSGGEKARLLLAKLAMDHDNFLVLMNQPITDIDSREVLENALIDFPGTILFVSHDRYFINRVATKVLEIAPEGSTEFLGDYDYYVEKKEEVQAESNSSENGEPIESLAQQDFTAQKEAQKNRRKVEREIKACEEKLADLETKIAAQLLEMQENTADFVKLGELQAEIDLFNDEKDEMMTL
ncbi:ABC-F family ATP-binding cassette domain-containing protein [Lactococcus lactis]